MSGDNPSSNWLRIAVVLIVAYMVVYALTPFSTSEAGPHYALRGFHDGSTESGLAVESFTVTVPQIHCSAPILDARRAPARSSGWFGYAPLSTTTFASGAGCQATSRHRLQMSLLGLIVAFALVLVARRIDRRPGLGFDPAPT